MNILALLPSGKKSSGSRAIEDIIGEFDALIYNLTSALSETEGERAEAEEMVNEAERNRDRIDLIITKGDTFLSGLKTLLQG